MDHRRGLGFRTALGLGIVASATVVLSGTVYVVGGGSHPVNVTLIVAVAAVGFGLCVWTALYGPDV